MAHEPKICKSCGAPIFWGAVLDENGNRIFQIDQNGRRRVKAMPVDVEPVADGNIILLDRPGEGIVCRVLKEGEVVVNGAKLRISHFTTCPQAKQWRK